MNILLTLLLIVTNESPRDQKRVGGGCDGCELMYIGMPAAIAPVDTSPGWREGGIKLMVRGTVYESDGKTPAPGVIVYYYHTDKKGLYSPAVTQTDRSRRHGHIRGWVKTDKNGEYWIYTSRPNPYPDRNIPAHIHLIVKEPRVNEYYIDEILFADDTRLTKGSKYEERGGSGIVTVSESGGLASCRRDIILGKNIPNYR